MKTEIESLVLDGGRLGRDETLYLFECVDLLWLAALADIVRRRIHPEPVVTYVIDRNVNYTNVCLSGCRFCAFYRSEGDPDSYLLTHNEIGAKIDEARELGAVSILLQGGLHPGLKIGYFEDLFSYIGRRHPIHLHALSPPEIVHIASNSGISVAETVSRLKKAGLGSIPGGGAEILAEGVRDRLSPHKCSAEEWVGVMREAHEQGLRTSATMMIGSVETPEDRALHLLRLRDLQDETGGFTAFIPWTFQPANTALEPDFPAENNQGAVDYLRTLAASRLVLDNFRNVQASWVTQGAKVAQLALRFGTNDFGSTMIEENVVAAAGVTYRISEEEIIRHISDAGFTPRRRNATYTEFS
jgi:cyclic dehypoxanthinyl futalosine synthase